MAREPKIIVVSKGPPTRSLVDILRNPPKLELTGSRKMNQKIDQCGCEESQLYRKVLEEVRDWLHDLGANDVDLGPMNDDPGAAALYNEIEAALKSPSLES